MGQHIQLYASKNVSLESARVWMNMKAEELSRVATDTEKPIVASVESEMARIRNSGDHLNHWASWGGSACFPFIAYEVHLIDARLVKRAEEAGLKYRTNHIEANPGSSYARHDWENDDIVEFLRSHIGFVLWCDPDF